MNVLSRFKRFLFRHVLDVLNVFLNFISNVFTSITLSSTNSTAQRGDDWWTFEKNTETSSPNSAWL